MTKRMLIDATHAEETRVVVLDGNRLEDFDVETSTKKQLKGNIYLAKIVRVEPSLQAAFVEYGGSRHGFLAFGEIHPDYYQIPIADRQRLIAQQEEEAREAEEAEEAAAQAEEAHEGTGDQPVPARVAAQALDLPSETIAAEPGEADGEMPHPVGDEAADFGSADMQTDPEDPLNALAAMGLHISPDGQVMGSPEAMAELHEALAEASEPQAIDPPMSDPAPTEAIETEAFETEAFGTEAVGTDAVGADASAAGSGQTAAADEAEAALPAGEESEGAAADEAFAAMADVPMADQQPPETLGGEAEIAEERERKTPSPRYLRHYKIQEVIRRRQIMLVQVVKEERGGKGAALTTYISLAGRFCVLMPNSPRGGGISRKITSAADRRRLKEVTTELDLPSGMGLIVRTAGAARPKPEIKRDCEYLLELWDEVRDTTMRSVAPAAIYEEASLIKRAIRDVYSRDVDEVQVDGKAAWQAARDQMRLLMPDHAHKVQLWQDPSGQPLFAHHQVDAQIDAMMSPTVQLRSGGYLVIDQTEALVAIDVNSGRSTRERGIEETALRTNLEAADEVARQLRLRDLAGLIVIDFIDMDARRNNTQVERRLKDALKNDRARIQLGSISHFGLMEMSRQRLRPSLSETSFVDCPHCGGTGHVRSTEGAAIHVLRAIEEEGGKRRTAEMMVHVAGPTAMYILNHKRDRLREIEARCGTMVMFTPDATLLPPALRIEKLRAFGAGEAPVQEVAEAVPVETPPTPVFDDGWASDERDATGEVAGTGTAPAASGDGESGDGRRRRRRRRRGGRRGDEQRADGEVAADADDVQEEGEEGEEGEAARAPYAADADASADALGLDGGAVTSVAEEDAEATDGEEAGGAAARDGTDESGQRRRGRRGGRRRRRGNGTAGSDAAPEPEAETPPPAVYEPVRSYAGPTPADPFGGGVFDFFDALEQAEALQGAHETAPVPVPVPVPMPMPVHTPDPVAAGISAEMAQAPPVEAAPETVEPSIEAREPVETPEKIGALEPVEAPEPVLDLLPAVPLKPVRRPRAPRKTAATKAAEAAALADAAATGMVMPTLPQAAMAVPAAGLAVPGAEEAGSEDAAEAAAQPAAEQDAAPAKRGWWRR